MEFIPTGFRGNIITQTHSPRSIKRESFYPRFTGSDTVHITMKSTELGPRTGIPHDTADLTCTGNGSIVYTFGNVNREIVDRIPEDTANVITATVYDSSRLCT